MDPSVVIDALAGSVVDELRRSLHPVFGIRAFRVYTVLRTWSGSMPGEGAKTDVELEIEPQPLIASFDGIKFTQEPCGLEELGEIEVSEVSLTYTHAELVGPSLTGSQEWLIKIAEAHGQAQPARYFVHDAPPFPDREQGIGWKLRLRKVNIPGAP